MTVSPKRSEARALMARTTTTTPYQIASRPVENPPRRLDHLPLHLVLGGIRAELRIEYRLVPRISEVEALVRIAEVPLVVLRGGAGEVCGGGTWRGGRGDGECQSG
jgi:hypothetical protein